MLKILIGLILLTYALICWGNSLNSLERTSCAELLDRIFFFFENDSNVVRDSYFNYGKMVRFRSRVVKRDISKLPSMRVVSFNAENLSDIRLMYKKMPDGSSMPVGELPYKKPEIQLNGVAAALNNIDGDIVVLQETSGFKVVSALNDSKLDHKYFVASLPGNGDKSRQITFLIRKKDFPVGIELHSFKNYTFKNGRDHHDHFMRDMPILILRDLRTNQPILAIAGVHAPAISSNATKNLAHEVERALEIEAALELRDLVRERLGKNLAFMMAGDFNLPIESYDLKPLFNAGMKNTHDMMSSPFIGNRFTHVFFPDSNSVGEREVFDAILLDGAGKSGLVSDSRVYRYRDSEMHELPIPRDFNERSHLPSGHYPVYVDINTAPLLLP